MRGIALLVTLTVVLVACAPAPPPAAAPKADPTAEAGYGEAAGQLAALNREAEGLLEKGKFDEAAAAITKGQPLQSQLLAAPHPTLAAMEAVSDLDDLYGRMLVRNQHYGFARGIFQKNLARWKHWKPETPDSQHRLQVAAAAIADCDRHLTQ